jgi:hypothetical protein
MEMMALPLGNDSVMKGMLEGMSLAYAKEKAFRAACHNRHNDIATIERMLQQPGLNHRRADSLILRDMCRIGRTDVVKLLLDLSPAFGPDPTDRNCEGFRMACSAGNIDIVRLFLEDPHKRVNPNCWDYESNSFSSPPPIVIAASEGFHAITKLLLDDGRVNHYGVYEALGDSKDHATVELLLTHPHSFALVNRSGLKRLLKECEMSAETAALFATAIAMKSCW